MKAKTKISFFATFAILLAVFLAAAPAPVHPQAGGYQAGTNSSLPGITTSGGGLPLIITGTGSSGSLLLKPSGTGTGAAILQVQDGGGNIVFQTLGSAGAYQVQFGGGLNAHLTLGAANGDIAGRVTCATNTVTKNFSSPYTSAPTVILSDETTKGGASTTPATGSFVVSCTGASDVVDYFVIGNPN